MTADLGCMLPENLRQWKMVGKKGRNTFCEKHKVPFPGRVVRLPFRDLITVKHPRDVIVRVEHDASNEYIIKVGSARQ
jgi:hypothetical protein